MSIELPFERVQHFRSNLKYGEEDTTVFRAELGDKAIYIARSYGEEPKERTHRATGELVLETLGKSREIKEIKLPYDREMDPIARERALTLLALTALQEIPNKADWDEDALLFGIPTEKEAFGDEEYRKVLGMRKRGTGRLSGGRNESFMTRAQLSEALGYAQDALVRVQSYHAPFPESESPSNIEWIENGRTA